MYLFDFDPCTKIGQLFTLPSRYRGATAAGHPPQGRRGPAAEGRARARRTKGGELLHAGLHAEPGREGRQS